MHNPYSPPRASLQESRFQVRYAGFWLRLAATLIDSLLMAAITWPLSLAVYGRAFFEPRHFLLGPADVLINYLLPFVAILAFWQARAATPGKLALGLRIIDATEGGKPSSGQFLVRYFSYLVSMAPLLLGFVWVAFDARKQAWHDKLAGTVVVRIVYE